MSNNIIHVKGARVHNLKNVSVSIPKNKLVVITGISGSGKSSLAFDTLFAEGQRRYVESMSTFARQFLGVLEKPDIDEIQNLSPALSIDQKTAAVSPRSTVGTMSEIYDYMRLLFTSIGVPHCMLCTKPMEKVIDRQAQSAETAFNHDWVCRSCQSTFPKITISLFSFNSPVGACRLCHGLGERLEVDSSLIMPNTSLTIEEGAIRPLQRMNSTGAWVKKTLEAMAQKYSFKLDVPVSHLSARARDLILFGDGQEYEGVVDYLMRRYDETDSEYLRREIEHYMVKRLCPDCQGKRLRRESLSVYVAGYNCIELASLSIIDMKERIESLSHKNSPLTSIDKQVSDQLFNEILKRLQFLIDVGLPYLTLDRSAQTLAGGEAQRIRLAGQLGSGLVNVIYILNEPSIGLHPRDHTRLLGSIKELQKHGNTVIVVEHDLETMKAADWIIDVGPGAGEHGGEIVGEGTIEDIKNAPRSITGAYLRGDKKIETATKHRKGNGTALTIVDATQFNLKNITACIPLQMFVAITGVSGSGKSTLISDILAAHLSHHFFRAKTTPGAHTRIDGVEHIDKVIVVDQSPIGRNVRSNPATYTGVFTHLRQLYSELPRAIKKKFGPDQFSFNLRGGRCEMCRGEGLLKFEMHFMPNVFITCEECAGKRYNQETLAVTFKGATISDVLSMTVDHAIEFFTDYPDIVNKLAVLSQVGLGYLRLGQPATMLSGGEAQRVKLANELARPSTGKTLYILDEPTTGLHFDDTARLLTVLHKLVDKGNSVLVVEHNLDIIKNADWVIDLGPEGGKGGGYIVAQGTPETIAKVKESHTGRYLSEVL